MPLEIGEDGGCESMVVQTKGSAAWNQGSARDGFGLPLSLKIAVDDDDLVRR
jgi:hypothetical protein